MLTELNTIRVILDNILPFPDRDGDEIHAIEINGDLHVSQQVWEALRKEISWPKDAVPKAGPKEPNPKAP